MSNIFIVLGYIKTRKSFTIRALTGVYNRRVMQVATQAGNINIFVQIRSLQELGIAPQNFATQIANRTNVLVSLRVSPGNRQPDGLKYIQTFINNGCTISQIVVLGTNNLPYNLPVGLPSPLFIPNSRTIPPNQIAHQIRAQWGWK
ncbi:unnamed protein product [marine sediment metagenome]|uniref:Uncharacterized protein n=1 Tax=marine sediment metagenome TaxID=412755 RepID=X1I8B0_9ZZZZ